MMFLLLLTGLLSIVYLDARTLKAQDRPLYDRVLEYTPVEWCLLFLAISPVYFFRRHQFLQQLSICSFNDEQRRLSQITEAAGIVVAWVVLMFWGTMISGHLIELYGIYLEELEEALIVSVVSLLLMIFLIYRVSQKSLGEGFLTIVGLRRRGNSLLKLIFFPMFIGISLACVAAGIILNRPETPLTPLTEVLEKTKSSTTLLLFLAVATLFAPLLEEMIFRGYFFSVIRRLRGRVFAIYLISGIFTFLHMGQYWGDWLAICIVGVLGFTLTILREWTGSTISSAVAHYAYNLFIVIIPVILFFGAGR